MAGFSNRQSYKSVSYKVYVPENCNANTEVLVYCHGGDDTNSNYATNYLNQYGGDTVIIFPTADSGFRETNEYGAQVVDVVNNVKQSLNITNDNLSVAGFSMGSTPTYTIMGEYLKQNPNCGSQTMFLLDNYPNANYSGVNKFDSLLKDYGSYYKDNNTLFVAMIPQWQSSGTYIIGSKQKELDYLAQHGISNVSVLHSYKATYPGKYPNLNLSGEAHHIVEQGFWVDGFFNMSTNSSVTFGENEYKLTILNKVTGQYEVTDFANLNSLDKLRQYFGINIAGSVTTPTVTPDVDMETSTLVSGEDFLKDEISNLSNLSLFDVRNKLIKSDKDRLLGNVNNVLSNIKNTSFVSNGLNLSFGGSSTTKVPSGIPNIIGLYFTFATDLLTELSSFMNKVGEAGDSIEKLDELFKEEASTLNDSATLNGDTTTLPLTSTTDNNGLTTDTTVGNNGLTTNNNSGLINNTGTVPNINTNNNTQTESTSPVYNSRPSGNTGYGSVGNTGSSYVPSNNTSSGVTNATISNNTGSSTTVSGSGITNVPDNNSDKVTATINQETIKDITTVVRDENANSNTNINTTPNTNEAEDISSIIGSTKPIGDINIDIDIPKNDSNFDNPVIEDILNDNTINKVPVIEPSTEINNTSSKSSFNGIGLGIGAIGATVAAGALISKSLKEKKENEDDTSLSKKDEADIKQYKDDYFEEV